MTRIWLCWLCLACEGAPNTADASTTAPVVTEAAEGPVGGSSATPAPAPAKLGAGSIVWAEWSNGRWFRGTIAGPCDEGFQISYDDGSHACRAPALVQPDRTPAASEVAVGTTLLAQFEQAPERYQAQITEVTPGGYNVLFSDGERGVNTLDQLRALPKDWARPGSAGAGKAPAAGSGLPSCHEVAMACKERSDRKSQDCWFACDGDEGCRSICQSTNQDERWNCDNHPDRECERR